MYGNSSTTPSSSSIPIVNCTTLDPPSPLFIYPNSQMYDTSSTIPLFIYYPNSQMYDTSFTIPPLHLPSDSSNVRHFIHHPPSSSTTPIVKCTTLHPSSPLFIYPNSQMYDTSSTIPLFIYYPNSQMYDTSSTIYPSCTTLHSLSIPI